MQSSATAGQGASCVGTVYNHNCFPCNLSQITTQSIILLSRLHMYQLTDKKYSGNDL